MQLAGALPTVSWQAWSALDIRYFAYEKGPHPEEALTNASCSIILQDVQLVGDFLRNALAASAGANGGLRQWNLLVADEQGVKLGELLKLGALRQTVLLHISKAACCLLWSLLQPACLHLFGSGCRWCGAATVADTLNGVRGAIELPDLVPAQLAMLQRITAPVSHRLSATRPPVHASHVAQPSEASQQVI